MRARRAGLAAVAAALVAGVAPVVASAPAQAACATNTGKSISGSVFGQDNRDVNVSIGFDLVDRNGRALNADPKSPGYGCAKTGGYSVPQSYLNHFVGPEGQAQGSEMKDAQGYYVLPSLASKQKYVLWLTTTDGKVHKRFGVPVSDCKATPLSWRV